MTGHSPYISRNDNAVCRDDEDEGDDVEGTYILSCMYMSGHQYFFILGSMERTVPKKWGEHFHNIISLPQDVTLCTRLKINLSVNPITPPPLSRSLIIDHPPPKLNSLRKV